MSSSNSNSVLTKISNGATIFLIILASASFPIRQKVLETHFVVVSSRVLSVAILICREQAVSHI